MNFRQRFRPQKARSRAIAVPNWIQAEGSGIGPPANTPIVGISVPVEGRNPERWINEPGSATRVSCESTENVAPLGIVTRDQNEGRVDAEIPVANRVR